MALTTAEESNDKPLVREVEKRINDFMLYCLDIFGEDFYLEVAPAETPEQIVVNKKNTPYC